MKSNVLSTKRAIERFLFPGAAMILILPTDGLIEEGKEHQRLLAKANLSVKQIVETTLVLWAQTESGATYVDYWSDDPLDERVATTIVDCHLNDVLTPYLTDADFDLIVKLIFAICRRVFLDILPLLQAFEPSEYQLQTFRIEKWLSRSLAVWIHY